VHQAIGVVLAFSIAGNLGADHTGCVIVVFRTADTPDGPFVEQFDLKRAS
jgi:hypothetical protein